MSLPNKPEVNSNLASASSVPSPSPLGAPTALIVDDNEFNRDIVRIALQSQGYIVTDYEDPVAAVGFLKERTFDLLVLDLQMPVLDGQQVLTIVRANPIHNVMHIIVLTAHSQMDTMEIQKNADFIMYKPISVPAFAQFAHRLQTARKRTPSQE